MSITFDALKSSFVSVEVKKDGVWEKVSRISGEISDDVLIVASKSLPEGCQIVSEQTKDVFVPDVSRPHEAQGFPDDVSLWKFHRKEIGEAGQILVVPQQEPCSFDRLNQKKLDGIEEGAQVNAVTSVNGKTGDVTIEPVTRVSELMNDAGYISSAPVTSVNGKTGDVVIRKSDVGLDKVENLPLSEFTGSENIRLLGKVERGQWNADPIKKQKIEGASEWDAKLDSIDGLVQAGDGIRIDGAGTPESPLTIVNTRTAGSRAGGAVGSVVKTLNGEKGAVSLIGGTNIDVVKGGNGEITINATGSASGESNTASNLGSGAGVYASKVGVDLRFKSLVAGDNVTITPSGTELRIDASAGGAVDSVNGQTGVVVLDADDVGAATSAQGALADTALQPSYLSAGTNVTFSGSGTSGSPLVINASGGGGGAVDSVNGQTGVVVLDADDIDDSATSHKFVTAGDLTTLANTSGTNTGDQTDITGNAGTVSSIAGKIDEGTNVTITGNGTQASPYVISASGIPDAPSDGDLYARKDGDWEALGDLAALDSVGNANLDNSAVTNDKLADEQFPLSARWKQGPNAVISGGIIQVNPKNNYCNIDTEGGAATDDLTDILTDTGGDFPTGSKLIIRTLSGARDVTIKHNASSGIYCWGGKDIELRSVGPLVELHKVTSVQWTARVIAVFSDTELAFHMAQERAALGIGALGALDSVGNANMTNMTAATYKGRNTGTGAPQDLPLVGDMIDGAIIERGSNANGEFVKFADGTMICWSPLITVDVNNARGNVFCSAVDTNDFITWDFPATFLAGSSPHLHGSFQTPANAQGPWVSTSWGGNTQGRFTVWSATTTTGRVITATAIGKWK